MMKQGEQCTNEVAQMLLATGVVLLMSLLSMAIFGVKVAGLTLPHDPASDDVIVATEEVISSIEPLTQARADIWLESSLNQTKAVELAFNSVHDDLLHHGEIRGVEIKLTNITFDDSESDVVKIYAQLGVSDGEAMLTVQLQLAISVS